MEEINRRIRNISIEMMEYTSRGEFPPYWYTEKMDVLIKWRQELERREFLRLSNAKARQLTDTIKNVAVTICPAECSKHNILWEIIEILTGLTSVLDFSAVFEQRSKFNEEEYGWHMHLAVKTKYCPAALKKFIDQKLQAKKRNIRAFTCVKLITDDKWEQNYMKGNKFNPEKQPAIDKDRFLRNKYNIPDIIYKGKTPIPKLDG